MKFQLLLLWLCATIEVSGLAAAIPWEVMWFYQAYKSEFATLSPSARTIATGCVHDAANFPAGEANYLAEAAAAASVGICTFDEFVRNIGGGGGFDNFPFTEDGATINPDWSRVKSKFTGTMKVFAFRNLLPTYDWGVAGTKVPYADVIPKINNAMQEARLAALTATEVVSDNVDRAVALSKQFARIVQEVRINDGQKALIKYANTFLRVTSNGLGYPAQTKTNGNIKDPIGNNITPQLSKNTLDTDKILATATTATAAQKEAFRSNLALFGLDATGVEHSDVIEAYDHVTDELADINLFAGCL